MEKNSENMQMQGRITGVVPEEWKRLEALVAAILSECGMRVRHGTTLSLPRGSVDVDVYAEEDSQGIVHRTVCECKHWQASVPKTVVHAFRTVMEESGANRGYIISMNGFQAGAIEAAVATNIELVTFEEFQQAYFRKWIERQIWVLERTLDGFGTYYEPLGPPGYAHLKNDAARAAYDEVWDRYRFAGEILHFFSPYLRQTRWIPFPAMPFDCSQLDKEGIAVPGDIRAAAGYRELFELLMAYGLEGRKALRAVNPITRGKADAEIEDED